MSVQVEVVPVVLDVAVSNLVISSHNPGYMETITVSATVRNNGLTDLDNVTMAFSVTEKIYNAGK